MWDFFLKSITRVGIFILCAQTLLHLRPKAAYEKYMKLLVSVMLLVQLLSPIWALFGQSAGQGLEQRMRRYEELLQEGMEQIWHEEQAPEQIMAQLIKQQMLLHGTETIPDEEPLEEFMAGAEEEPKEEIAAAQEGEEAAVETARDTEGIVIEVERIIIE